MEKQALPSWVTDAAALPIAFAQVREDPLVDFCVVERLGSAARLIMIASGGCTLAFLAACPVVARIDVVDANPAQLALARLKLHLLQNMERADRLALLGHAPMPAAEREMALRATGVPLAALGPASVWARDGPDHAGRYERVFAQLRRELAPHADEVAELLSLQDWAEAARRVEPSRPLGRALDAAFARAMALPILVHLFGEGATRNRVEPFDRHFARQARHALATLPADSNPYLWQVLLGRYPPNAEAPWLSLPMAEELPEVVWHQATMTEVLAKTPGSYDFVHLSNILDWLSPEEGRTTLELAHAALRPGGWILIRQLNSTLDIPGLTDRFTWHTKEATALHAGDRSYFYRALHLGQKR
jgi:S-adenosylmethionine-diacylglycerol 3-amino-3-carboxypropyl transferase